MISFLREAAHVRPSQRQLDWFDMEAYAFVHFSPNTYTDLECGKGTEPESIFAPAHLDCDQWVAAVKAAGLKGLILTAKHHDGFCLWPSAYTEHSVKNCPYPRDIVKEASDACRRGGIKFGVYLSPWDRNSKYYGTPAYNDYYCNQLTELLTGYGDIFSVWFDGACGEGPYGKKQDYDFPRYIELIRRYQPNAVIFNDHGPDVRWCGNEDGRSRAAEWSVVPSEMCYRSEVQTGPGPLAAQGNLDYLYNTEQSIGTMPNILYSRGLTFTPSEIDTSIRKGWFWHNAEEPYSLEHLFRVYLASVGENACLNLNVPPTRDGLFDERDVCRLHEFGDLLRKEFGTPLPASVEKEAGCPATQPKYRITPDSPCEDLHYIVLQEDIAEGQRVESFRITVNDEMRYVYEGLCIGHKKICVLHDPFTGKVPQLCRYNRPIRSITVHITAARGEVQLKNVQVF